MKTVLVLLCIDLPQIRCYIKKHFKLNTLVYVSDCHIIYLSLAKNKNDFRYLVFKVKLTSRTIFQDKTYKQNYF